MENKNTVIKALSMITQIGITMLVPILLCGWVGHFLDKKLGTEYLFIILLVLGILAAFRNVYLVTRQFYAKDKEREDKELKYFADLKKSAKKHSEDE